MVRGPAQDALRAQAPKWNYALPWCPQKGGYGYKNKDGWVYMDKLKNWTDAGMDLKDTSYIDACSGIVNRGCYNPPCGGNKMDGGAQRAANFAKVMKAVGLGLAK